MVLNCCDSLPTPVTNDGNCGVSSLTLALSDPSPAHLPGCTQLKSLLCKMLSWCSVLDIFTPDEGTENDEEPGAAAPRGHTWRRLLLPCPGSSCGPPAPPQYPGCSQGRDGVVFGTPEAGMDGFGASKAGMEVFGVPKGWMGGFLCSSGKDGWFLALLRQGQVFLVLLR